MNFFFGGAFSTYGSEVHHDDKMMIISQSEKSLYHLFMALLLYDQVLKMSNLDPENRNDPLNDVFPKVKVSSHTKCYPEENSFCV